MKTFALFGVVGTLVFMAAGYQMGIFEDRPATVADSAIQEPKKPAAPAARFPEDLARAVRQQPVPEAAAFDPEAKTHRIVILKASGALHPWQEHLPEDWQAETVEQTELVVVMLPERKKLVSHTPFGSAPPVDRFQWERGAYVVEARTGLVQAGRQFINMPRSLRDFEAYELTGIGQPVRFNTVFDWVASMALAGFPHEDNAAPLISVVD